MTPIPLTFRAAPLPEDFNGTPQEFQDMLVERLSATASTSLSFFSAGPTAPTSNVGPWLKNFVTWYVWSDSLATYVPETIESESLRYIASQTEPDQAKYVFWIKLDGSGKATGIFYYSGGAWKDVYEDAFAAINTNLTNNFYTKTQTDAAIEQAVSDADRHAFGAHKNATQTLSDGGGDVAIPFQSEEYDIGSDYNASTSTYVAPVAGIYSFKVALLVVGNTGSPTEIVWGLNLVVNGSIRKSATFSLLPDNFQTIELVSDMVLAADDEVTVTANLTTDAPATFDISPDTPSTFFHGFLIQKTS